MEMLVILGLVFLLAPIVLSIIASVRTSKLSWELEQIRGLVEDLRQRVIPTPPPAEPAKPEVRQPPPIPTAEPVRPKPPSPPVLEPIPVSAPARPPEKVMEVEIGGKWAAFVGIAALVIGVVFFVGYAIQRNWIGPGLRIVLGLICGAILVGLGYLAETRSRRLHILAQTLTGGGSALFYFSVFAAHGIYGLISAPLAIAGLAASAAAALGLAAAYNSQAVAILALLGAFITPVLIGGEFDRGFFPLVFIAGVNVPVIVLGLKRRWQGLYNLAFVFTVVLAAIWLGRELSRPDAGAWRTGLCFVLVYFAEFVALGMIKLERAAAGRWLDQLRLALCSLALLGAVYWIFEEAGIDDWTATAFLVLALAHAGLARLGWRWLPFCRDEVLVLLIGALTFASLALPIQLDGVWVSLGWAIEGVLLAWFALRIGSVPLQFGAIGLGLLGLGKSALYDFTLYEAPPRLFLNGRFAVGLLSAAALGAQGRLHGRSEKTAAPKSGSPWSETLACVAVLGLLLAIFTDGILIMGMDDPWMWLMTTAAIAAAGAALALAVTPDSNRMLWGLGVFFLLVVPLKMVAFDCPMPWGCCGAGYHAFRNGVFWLQLVNLAVVLAVVGRLAGRGFLAGRGGFTTDQLINLLSLGAGIAVVTLEIYRYRSPWAQSLITLWWAVCALALAVTGLARRRAYLRYMALFVFGLTVIKVFLVDLAGLSGLQRVAAFMGLGVLLLILSYAYQRVAPLLMGGKPEDKT